MKNIDSTTLCTFANVYMILSLALVTTYVKSRLENHMKSKHRWKVLLSAVGLLAFAAIGAVIYSQIGWSEYSKIVYALNIGAIAIIFFIGFPNLPKKKKK